MCCRQTVAKMDSERRSRSTCLSKMSTVSLDSGHVVVEVGDSLGYEARLVKAITRYLLFLCGLNLKRFCDFAVNTKSLSKDGLDTGQSWKIKCMALTSCED